jgi:hypothetical protein
MAYLISYDYLRQIQSGNLSQIITNNEVVKSAVELSAQAEAISYLRQKYNVDVEFTNTIVWDFGATYSAKNRVYLDADAYNTGTNYVADAVVSYLGSVYKCNTPTTGAFDANDWDLLGLQGTLYYAKLPFPEFNVYANYVVGDEIFWKDKTYTCKRDTTVIGQETALQYGTYANVPLSNSFPDAIGDTQWQFDDDYEVPADTEITDTDFWALGDNRDQQMVMYFIDITLFHLHSRIAPQNIPQLRVDRYNAAIDWLKMCANGDVTPKLTKIQPKEGMRIRWGGNVRNQNNY